MPNCLNLSSNCRGNIWCASLEKRIQREQITNRRYTKAEIVASLGILGEYLSENDVQKSALFETFVDKVVAYKGGKIVVNVDVFGTKAKIENIDKSVSTAIHHNQKSWGIIEIFWLLPLVEYFFSKARQFFECECFSIRMNLAGEGAEHLMLVRAKEEEIRIRVAIINRLELNGDVAFF